MIPANNETYGPAGSMSQVVGIPNNSYKHITNTVWVLAWLCKLTKKGALDQQPQVIKLTSCLLMVGGLYGYFATKTGHPDITEILIKVALNTTNQIKSNLTRTPLNKGYLVVKLKSSRHQVESITVATMTCLAITEYLCHK